MPATLTDAQLAEFQALYEKRFGKSIDKAEALDKGLALVRLLEMVLRNRANMPEATGPESINNNDH